MAYHKRAFFGVRISGAEQIIVLMLRFILLCGLWELYGKQSIFNHIVFAEQSEGMTTLFHQPAGLIKDSISLLISLSVPILHSVSQNKAST